MKNVTKPHRRTGCSVSSLPVLWYVSVVWRKCKLLVSDNIGMDLAHEALITNAADEILVLFILIFFFFSENKTWKFVWIDDSHEMPSLIFSEK